MSLLQEGMIIHDTYTVERLLGEGAFAEVYRVQHRFLGRQAMKVFKARGITLDELEEMLGEAVMLSRIGHPNVIRVFDANVTDISGTVFGYFTMEYVPGGTLDRYWRSYDSRLMPLEEAVDITRQICTGLAVSHGETPPVIHRDIKPQNILIGYDAHGMRVKVSDFGLAKQANPMTLLISAKGTLGFKPPESMENIDSCAADVWAIGTTLYLLLTDRLPFPGLEERDTGNATRFTQQLRPPSFYNIQVDPILDSIVARCLAISQDGRYGDAGELLHDLTVWKPVRSSRSAAAIVRQTTSGKTVVGNLSPINKDKAKESAEKAIALSTQLGKLPIAADMLEEAMNKDPDLRQQYGSQLKLWRRGISM